MDDDVLYSDEFKDIIVNFCKIASNTAYIKDVSAYIEAFRRSQILRLLLADPQHDGAKTCVMSYLADNPTIPNVFLSRFLAIANAKIQIAPVRIGASMNNSCMVTVIPASTKPPSKITNLTANAKRDRLREDAKNVQTNHASKQNVAARVRVNYSAQLLDQLVNSMIGFHKIIDEGNRQNGYQVDSYIKVSKNL